MEEVWVASLLAFQLWAVTQEVALLPLLLDMLVSVPVPLRHLVQSKMQIRVIVVLTARDQSAGQIVVLLHEFCSMFCCSFHFSFYF